MTSTEQSALAMIEVETLPIRILSIMLCPLAPTKIESAFQSRSSCITCHSIASIAKKLPENPDDLLRKSFVEVGVTPPYYVGESPDLAPFVSMDFAWSLRRAKLKQ